MALTRLFLRTTMTRSTTIRLGDGETHDLTVTRGIDDSSETDYVNTFVRYECWGVESVDITTGYEIGGEDADINVTFENSRKVYLTGQVEEVNLHNE